MGGLAFLKVVIFLTMLRWRTPGFCSNVAAQGWNGISFVAAPVVETLVLFAGVLTMRALLRLVGLHGFALGYAVVSCVATQQHLYQGVWAAVVVAIGFCLQASVILRTADDEGWLDVIAFLIVVHALSNVLNVLVAKAAAALTC